MCVISSRQGARVLAYSPEQWYPDQQAEAGRRGRTRSVGRSVGPSVEERTSDWIGGRDRVNTQIHETQHERDTHLTFNSIKMTAHVMVPLHSMNQHIVPASIIDSRLLIYVLDQVHTFALPSINDSHTKQCCVPIDRVHEDTTCSVPVLRCVVRRREHSDGSPGSHVMCIYVDGCHDVMTLRHDHSILLLLPLCILSGIVVTLLYYLLFIYIPSSIYHILRLILLRSVSFTKMSAPPPKGNLQIIRLASAEDVIKWPYEAGGRNGSGESWVPLLLLQPDPFHFVHYTLTLLSRPWLRRMGAAVLNASTVVWPQDLIWAVLAVFCLLAVCLVTKGLCIDRRDVRVIVIRHFTELSLVRKASVASTPILQSVLKQRMVLIDVPRNEVISPRDMVILSEAASDPSTLLLFPSSQSKSLVDLIGPACSDTHCGDHHTSTSMNPRTLIVVDGSWKTATSLVYKNSILRRISHVHIPPEQVGVSEYMKKGLRTEPRRGFVSTAEATAIALQIISGGSDRACEVILRRFRSFVVKKAAIAESTSSERKLSAMRTRKLQCADEYESQTFENREWALLEITGKGIKTKKRKKRK